MSSQALIPYVEGLNLDGAHGSSPAKATEVQPAVEASVAGTTAVASSAHDSPDGDDKKSVKYLTCWFWKNKKHCTKSAEDCLYSHEDTGMYAERPQRFIAGGAAYAGKNADKMAVELNMATFRRRHTVNTSRNTYNPPANGGFHGGYSNNGRFGYNAASPATAGQMWRYNPNSNPGMSMMPIMEHPGAVQAGTQFAVPTGPRRLTVGAGRTLPFKAENGPKIGEDKAATAAKRLDEGICALMSDIVQIKSKLEVFKEDSTKTDMLNAALDLANNAAMAGSRARYEGQLTLWNDTRYHVVFGRNLPTGNGNNGSNNA